MRMIPVQYQGFAVMDRRFSAPMMQWVLAEIKMRNTSEKMFLTVSDGYIKGFSASDAEEPQVKELLFKHPLHDVKKYSQLFLNNCTFLYLMLDPVDHNLLNCYLYLTKDPQDVMELLTAMREQRDSSPARGASAAAAAAAAGPAPRSLSNAGSLTSLCADISLNSSHFFEVLYIGKVKVSQRKVPDSFIDDALEKFRLHDLEKGRLSGKGSQPLVRNNSHSRITGKDVFDRRGSQDSSCAGSDMGSSENISHPMLQVLRINSGSIEAFPQPQMSLPPGIPTISLTTSSTTSSTAPAATSEAPVPPVPQTADTLEGEAKPQTEAEQKEELEPMRSRAGSAGSALAKKPETTGANQGEHNRTMLFLVGRTDLRLISPDRKQILLHKNLHDVVLCIQGVAQSDHFGFICREVNVDQYIGYVFKCQSESFADDVVAAITQAFQATNEHAKRDRSGPIISCEHCPMVWYHKLCTELEGQSDKRVQQAIYRKLQQLPEEEQDVLLTKFRGSDNSNQARGLREQNEFLMMLIRAHCESKQSRHVHDTAENRSEFLNQYLGGSTIFMKAKRSLTSSFDHLLKRRGSRDDFAPMAKELSLPMNASIYKEADENGAPDGPRPRSSTLGSSDMPPHPGAGAGPGAESPSLSAASSHSHLNVGPPGTPPQKGSPMMNIFLKMGSNSKMSPSGNEATEDVHRHSGSWRQAIFKTVVTPKKEIGEGEKSSKPKRSPEELRQLWKKAINQQVLLIRMDKENARIRARQEEKEVKRIKLEYDEIGSGVQRVMEVWDLLDSKENRFNARCDNPMLIQAIRQGVPRSKRGDVWHYLAEQFCLKAPPIDLSKFPNYNVPYEHLLKQLTSHQHAILIDLGRTFPNHAYFSSPLGPGQLALFNILKAYSLLDPEVGYCQGLSFVAGVLLLHMSEDNAFFLLRHLMFRRGLRRQYLPDMAALHVHLYQLSRLLHDQLPELFCHLDRHEVTATLYAAPWMLTLFASQFPLGFVTRVFDLLFVESPEVIFRVSIALMIEHKEGLMNCGSFEEIIDYLKTRVPLIDKNVLDRVLKKVFIMDISKQLNEYEVEYHVLQEEQSTPRPEAEKLKVLTEENRALLQQVEMTTSNLKRLENSNKIQQAQMNRLESQIRSLEVSISTLGGFIASLTENHKDIEIPGDVRRLVAQLTAPQPDRRKNSGNLGLGNIFKHSEQASHASHAPPKPEAKHELPRQSKSDPPKDLHQRRAFPLKVIQDDEAYEAHSPLKSSLSLQSGTTLNKVKNVRPYPLKSAMSSPNLTAKVSSLFGQNHERNHPEKEKSNANGVLIEEPVAAKENARAKDGSFIDVPLESNEVTTREPQSDGQKPPLRKDEIMKQLEAVVNTKVSSDTMGTQELIAHMEHIEGHESGKCHPLDSCSDVCFSYGGTTKLKTIRPLRAQLSRNATIATIDTNSFNNHQLSRSPGTERKEFGEESKREESLTSTLPNRGQQQSPGTERKNFQVVHKKEERENVPLANRQRDLL